MVPLDNSTPFHAPPTLGEYEMLGGLARGGMASVYLARRAGEAGFQRLFAIKILHPHLADDKDFINMLLDEARIAARLHHPNVVPVVDLGSQDGFHYIVMEYIEGCSLNALLKRYRYERPPKVIVPVILDALAGLHAAHTLKDDEGNLLNLVHRDVSPQNIMVGVDGTARIADFGVARAEARIHSTRPGELKGKIAFMSPEQITDSSSIDHRADIFSAGVVLWMALTGRRLFLGEGDAATLHNILHLEIPPPSQVGFKPPDAFDAVCLKALARVPNERYATAAEFEEALREAALASDSFGSHRQVSEWVDAAFSEELSERRKSIRSFDSKRMSMSGASWPSAVSGMRAIQPAGLSDGGTPADAGSTPKPEPRAFPSDAPTISKDTVSKDVGQQSNKHVLLLAAVASAAVLLAFVVALTRRPTATAETTANASTSLPLAATAEAPAPAPAAPTAEPQTTATAAAGDAKSAEPSGEDPPAAPAAQQRPAPRRRRAVRPPPPPPPPEPPAPAPKKPSNWDHDSPLLPP